MRLLLASASPRRADLLRAAGFDFDVLPVDVDERLHPGEDPAVYALRVAEEKARGAAARAPDRLVIAADTVVVVDGIVLGKPSDPEDARRMLRRLSGRTHQVLTAVAVMRPRGPGQPPSLETRVETTTVEFAPMTEAEIDWYVASGEPMDKAGGYAIQGLASRFVTRIRGSYSNVVGLPVALVYQMLRTGP